MILNADDFYDENNGLDLLFEFRSKLPGFKITMFAIPARCSNGFLKEVEQIEWIDLVPHGLNHETARECELWTYAESLEYLVLASGLGWTKGFKAPGWNVSDGLYQALLERRYWIADHPKNNARRPEGLPVYLPGQGRYHFHIGPGFTNSLDINKEFILSMQGEFKFIDEVIHA